MDTEVTKALRKIKTGELAISFFAKYGNATPIKFINCVMDENTNKESFRPYDLKVIHNISEN